MRTPGALLCAILIGGACDPEHSPSPERQANGRACDGEVLEGPAEQVVTDAYEIADAKRMGRRCADAETVVVAVPVVAGTVPVAPPFVATGRPVPTPRVERVAPAAAWDLRMLDLLAVHLDVSEQMATAVAERGDTDALRAWAREEALQAQRWRDRIGELRAELYGDSRPPRLAAAPGLEELGPITQRLARRWEEGRPQPANMPSRPLTPGQEYLQGVSPDVGPDDGEQVPFALVATNDLGRLTNDEIRTSAAADVFGPLLKRAVHAATSGTMQASRADLRDLALDVQMGETRSLARLQSLLVRERERPGA